MVLVEFAKMRRLRLWLVAGVVSLGTVLFSSMQLFSDAYVERIDDPATAHWQSALLFYPLIKAMTAPILVAVIASRQVEVEHAGNGWTMGATLGRSRCTMCLAKVVALTPVVAATTAFELGALVVGGRLAGATAALPITTWAWYAAASFAITLTLLAAHVWLSAHRTAARAPRGGRARRLRRSVRDAHARLALTPPAVGVLRRRLPVRDDRERRHRCSAHRLACRAHLRHRRRPAARGRLPVTRSRELNR